MADDPVLPLRGTAPTAATAKVRATEAAGGGLLQHVRIDLGSGTTEAQASGTLPVSAAALPLPSGAATQVTLAEVDTTLDSILAAMSGSAAVDSGSSVTVGATTTQILAADATRKGLILYFEADTYVAFGAAATSAALLFLAGSYLNMLTGFIWKGAINGLRVGGSDVTVRKAAF
jgi:hypothetical protein